MEVLSTDPLDKKLKEDIEKELLGKGIATWLIPNTVQYLTRKCMLIPSKELCIKNTTKELEIMSEILKDYIKENDVNELNKQVDELNDAQGTNIPKFPLYMTKYSTAAYVSIATFLGACLFLALIIILFTLLFLTNTINPQTARKCIIFCAAVMVILLALFLAFYYPVLLYFDQLHKYELENIKNNQN